MQDYRYAAIGISRKVVGERFAAGYEQAQDPRRSRKQGGYAVEEGKHSNDKDSKNDADFDPPVNEEAQRWESRNYSDDDDDDDRADRPSPSYGSFRAERDAWNS